jgi:hypothetical protein
VIRRRAWWVRAALPAAIAASTVIIPSTASARSPSGAKGIVFLKGKLITDGLLTVGQPETVRVKGLPAKTRLTGAILPPPSERNCFDPVTSFCIPGPLPPAPGSPRFKTDGTGRATLTFIMVDHYDLIAGESEHVTLVNGQVIVANFSGRRPVHRGGKKVILDGYANAKALVEVREPAPSS